MLLQIGGRRHQQYYRPNPNSSSSSSCSSSSSSRKRVRKGGLEVPAIHDAADSCSSSSSSSTSDGAHASVQLDSVGLRIEVLNGSTISLSLAAAAAAAASSHPACPNGRGTASERQLLNVSSLCELEGQRVGVDAVYWLRGVPAFADPLLAATGETRKSLLLALEREVHLLRKAGLSPVFVFRGIEPPGHRLFAQKQPQQEAWEAYYSGGKEAAMPLFAAAAGRLTAEDERLAMLLLQQLGCEVLQAPYLAPPQLAYLVQLGLVDLVLGPPSAILFGVSRVVTQLDMQASLFVWLEKHALLAALGVTLEQLVDSCLLAGTDYSLTFPYLNLSQFQGGAAAFSFGAAVEFIRQAPFSSYIQQFPSEEMRCEHVDGYCIGKCLVSYPLVLREDGDVCILEAGSAQPSRCSLPPKDFSQVVGLKLPAAVYVHLAFGLLSRELATALAQGDWLEPFEPPADSQEFSDAFAEVISYRRKALGLVTKCLHPKFQQRAVVFVRAAAGCPPATGVEALLPETGSNIGRPWGVSAAAVAAELQRQRRQQVDMAFCLQWVAAATGAEKRRLQGGESGAGAAAPAAAAAADMDSNALLAATLLQLLDAACLFTEEGDSTVFGSALSEVPHDLQEDVLICLELLKLGLLTGEPLEARAGSSYPKGLLGDLLQPIRGVSVDGLGEGELQRASLLLQRVASLLPLQHKPGVWWAADVCLDLRGFACIVTALKAAMRQLAEAALLHQLLRNPKLTQHLPPAAARADWLPTFAASGCCLGLLMRFFIRYDGAPPSAARPPMGGPPAGASAASGGPQQAGGGGGAPPSSLSAFEAAVRAAYPSAEDPVGDLCRAIRLWRVVEGVLAKISALVDAADLMREVRGASALLEQRIAATGLASHPAYTKAQQ
ncbi:hypothetical protein Efla_002802 [Eimeria flavescens]